MSARLCSFPDCGRRHNAKGLCTAHGSALRNGRELRPIAAPFAGAVKTCAACGKSYLPRNKGPVAWGRSRTCSLSCASRSRPLPSLSERLWFGVDKAGPRQPHMESDCWVWTRSSSVEGYGHIGVASGKAKATHRVSWELEYGPIPRGLFVLHRCDHPPCVRPDHLFLGTKLDNARDMARKGRQWAQQRPEEFRALRARLAANKPKSPPKPCGDCGRPTKPMRRGRCNACYRLLRVRGFPEAA